MPEEGGQRGAHSLRPGSGTRRVLELVEARLEAGEARLADAARRPLLVDEARLDEDVAAARRREGVAEARRLRGIEACTPSTCPVTCSTAWRAGSLAARRRSSAACTPSTRRRRDEMIATRRGAMARSWPRRLWTWHASQTSAWQPRLPRQMSARFTPTTSSPHSSQRRSAGLCGYQRPVESSRGSFRRGARARGRSASSPAGRPSWATWPAAVMKEAGWRWRAPTCACCASPEV